MVNLRCSFRAGLHLVPSEESLPRCLWVTYHPTVFPSDTDHLHRSLQSYDVFIAEPAGHFHHTWNCSGQHLRFLRCLALV